MRVVSRDSVGRGRSGASEIPITTTVRRTHRAVLVSGAYMPVCFPKPHRKSLLRGLPRSAIEACQSEKARLLVGWRALGLARVGPREARTTSPPRVYTHTTTSSSLYRTAPTDPTALTRACTPAHRSNLTLGQLLHLGAAAPPLPGPPPSPTSEVRSCGPVSKTTTRVLHDHSPVLCCTQGPPRLTRRARGSRGGN